ncbi:putative electron transport protein [Escherichia coli]|uniref:Putative electron transport protein n=1 Tax=Escherichia coli TaxID=562 RepID=A0A376TH95_ECOLX|nr:putative electron transport protein [Escherichia coli]
MAEKKRTRWQRRPGTTGGKLPWNDWRNATTWRKATQLLLLAMNIYIAITFWYWVRYYETASSTTFVARPGGIEGWLPIAGLMNLKYSLTNRSVTVRPRRRDAVIGRFYRHQSITQKGLLLMVMPGWYAF